MNQSNTSGQFSENVPLHRLNSLELVQGIHQQDASIAQAVAAAIPQIATLAEAFFKTLNQGNRVFYIGAGTSGRLGILDASELPPTYGIPHDWVQGIMAGGDLAMRKAVEFAEDDLESAWVDLSQKNAQKGDLLIGIAASGTTAYVLGGVKKAALFGLSTGCITCNPNAPLLDQVDFPVLVDTGVEFVRGSTRMKAGTAQKMVLNMLSTTAMIRLGKVDHDRMIDMQLSNKKLWNRAVDLVIEATACAPETAYKALQETRSVRLAIQNIKK